MRNLRKSPTAARDGVAEGRARYGHRKNAVDRTPGSAGHAEIVAAARAMKANGRTGTSAYRPLKDKFQDAFDDEVLAAIDEVWPPAENSDPDMPTFCDICDKRSSSLQSTPDGDICGQCKREMEKEMAEYDKGVKKGKRNADPIKAIRSEQFRKDLNKAVEETPDCACGHTPSAHGGTSAQKGPCGIAGCACKSLKALKNAAEWVLDSVYAAADQSMEAESNKKSYEQRGRKAKLVSAGNVIELWVQRKEQKNAAGDRDIYYFHVTNRVFDFYIKASSQAEAQAMADRQIEEYKSSPANRAQDAAVPWGPTVVRREALYSKGRENAAGIACNRCGEAATVQDDKGNARCSACFAKDVLEGRVGKPWKGVKENAAETHEQHASRVGKKHGSYSLDEAGVCKSCGWDSKQAKENADVSIPAEHLDKDRADIEEIARHAEGIEHEVGELMREDESVVSNSLLSDHQFAVAWDRQSSQFRGARLSNVGLPRDFADVRWADLPDDVRARLLEANAKNFPSNGRANKAIPESNIGEEIGHHIRDKGMPQKQAVAAAFSETRNSGVARGSSKYGTRLNYDTDAMKDELDAQLHDLIRSVGAPNQQNAKRMAQVLLQDAKGDLKKYILDTIGNEFDLQHYIENR